MPSEKKDIITSTACYFAMVAILAGLAFAMGPLQILKLYVVPYWVCVVLFISFFYYGSFRFVKLELSLCYSFFCRSLLCGWTLLPICITMGMMISFLGTVERYAHHNIYFSVVLCKLMYKS